VDRKAVDALHRAVVASGARRVSDAAELPAAIGGGYGFGCKDPDGRNLAFVSGVADHADAKDEPDRPRKIAHVNLNARRLRWQPAVLHPNASGFAKIDENAPLWFLRCASPTLVDRARQDQPADPQSRRLRDARLRFGHARHRADEG